MPGLPDIPQSRYQKYQADQFDRVTSSRIDAIGQPPDPEIEAVRAQVAPEYRDYVDRAVAAARANDIDPRIYVKQIYAESGFNPKAGSDEGAKGIAQFTDGTAKGWGVNPWDVDQALDGGARLMASNLKANGGDYRLALAAYNAGQGNVNRYGQRIFDAGYLKGQGWSDEDANQPSAYIQRILGDTSAASASGPPGAVWPAVAGPPSGPTAGPLNASQSAQDGPTGSSGGDGMSGVLGSARDSLANVPFDQYADSLIGTLHLPSISPPPSGTDSASVPGSGTGALTPSPAPPADFGSYADGKIASLNETTGQGQWAGAPADASATGGAGPQPAAGLDPSALGSGAASPDQADSPASYLTTDTQPPTEGATQLPSDLGSGAASPDQQPTPASDLPSAPFIRPSYDDMAGANSNGQPMGLSADTGVPPGIQETDTTSPRLLGGPTPVTDALAGAGEWIQQRVQKVIDENAAAYPTKPLKDYTPEELDRAIGASSNAVMGVTGGEDLTNLARGAAGDVTRFFHGTGSAFDRPDAAKFDANGLFGPGYYLTDSPEVASSYAAMRSEAGSTADDLARYQRRLAEPDLSPALRAQYQKAVDAMTGATGANVRAVNVPNGLNLLDADAPLPEGTGDAIAQAVPPSRRVEFSRALDAQARENLPTGQDAYSALNAAYSDKMGANNIANQILQAVGYDGIRYNGGQRIPLADEAGKPIEHTAIVVFPESLGKLTNAVSGTQFGSAVPIGGALVGGYEGSQHGDTPEERTRNALLGAAGGAAAGYGLERGAPLAGKALAPVRAAIDEWIAPARNAAPEVQAALRDFANRNLQGAVDAETLGLQAKHVLGANDSGATASLFERTGQVSPSPTADEATFAAHVRQFTNDTRDLGQQHGYLNGDVTAGPNAQVQAYFPHVYEENLNRATSAARKGGLNPNDFYSNARVYPTLDEAAANGLTPVDSFSGPLQHYAQRIASSEAKYQLVEDLKNASPAVAMDYTPGTTLPEGWVPGASIDRAFAPKPVPIPGATSVDQPGLTFTNGTAFEPNTAQAIKNILDPSWVRSTALGRGYLDTMGEGKKLLFSLSGFHNVTELRQAISANGIRGVPVVGEALKNGFVPGAWANWRLQHADLLSDAARAGVTGLAGPGKALDTGGGLSGPAAVALRSVAGAVAGGSSGYGISKAAGADDQTALRNGLIGAGLGAIAGPAMDPIANSLWERQVPTLKALTWQIQTAAGRDPEAAAAFVNNTFGGQNLAAIARSKTVQDVARTLFLAPDWWESWTNQLGNAFKGGDQGAMARAYWARTAITSAFTLEGLNYALNHHFTNANDPDHANQLEVTGLYKLLGVDRRDPKTGAPEREYMSVLPAPVESLLNLSGGQVTKFGLGRLGVLPRVAMEQAANKDYRGQPIVPPYTPTLEAARLRAANVLSQIAPIGVQQLETSSAGAEPASIAAFATATGLRTSPASKATYAGPQLSGASNAFLERNGLSWRPTPVGDAIGHVGLTRDERTYYQNLVDAARERAIASLASNPQWSRYSTAEKEAAMKTMEAHLDEEARIRVAAMIPRDEMQRRVRVKTAAGH